MPQSPPATSILELLTHPNPSVHHEKPRSKTNTHSAKYHFPQQIRKWEEFEDVNILKAMFGGSLLREASQGSRDLNPYPILDPDADCRISAEDDTRDLINSWNKKIVTSALKPIQHIFHPVIWSKGDSPKNKEKHPLPPRRQEQRRHQPSRGCSLKARQPRSQSLSRLQPDSGSIAWSPPTVKSDSRSAAHRQERFVKEYKPASKWNSESFFKDGLLDESGTFIRITRNLAWPIRQAYTYCIQHMCRYGCILTCEEAFIFRIMPREDTRGNDAKDEVSLENELIHNGLMEYVSIPWENHSRGGREEPDVWTVNLALWFVHILAGNNFEARWSYVDLADEVLILSQPAEGCDGSTLASLTSAEDPEDEQGQESDASDSTEDSDTTNVRTPSKPKRKRECDEEDEEERIHDSFSKRQNI